jgi:hypothetical protein
MTRLQKSALVFGCLLLMTAGLLLLGGCHMDAHPEAYPQPAQVPVFFLLWVACLVGLTVWGIVRQVWWPLTIMAVMWLAACSSTEGIRLDKSPRDTAQEAACQPLPACDIPPGANSTQLESALWACVLEYRALYSVCYHLARPLAAEPAEVF